MLRFAQQEGSSIPCRCSSMANTPAKTWRVPDSAAARPVVVGGRKGGPRDGEKGSGGAERRRRLRGRTVDHGASVLGWRRRRERSTMDRRSEPTPSQFHPELDRSLAVAASPAPLPFPLPLLLRLPALLDSLLRQRQKLTRSLMK